MITIAGTGFDMNFPANNAVSFATDGNTCEVYSVTDTELVCESTPFTTISVSAQNVAVSITTNTNELRRRLATVDSTETITQIDAVQNALSLSPNSVSPVLKTDLTITLASTYTGTIDANSFVVDLLDSAGAIVKNLFVISADAGGKTVLVKFPGAFSGSYSL